MSLDEYLRVNKIKASEFADKIGVTEGTISRLRNGHAWPDWATLEAILRETNQVVDANSFAEGLLAVSSPAA